jgi:hypothetical protein
MLWLWHRPARIAGVKIRASPNLIVARVVACPIIDPPSVMYVAFVFIDVP